MQAAVAVSPGNPLQIQAVPVPRVQRQQVLIKVMASSVNPLDAKIALGQGGHARQPLPAVLGIDVAGVIIEVGADVQSFTAGDQVFAMAGGVGAHQGSHAQYIAVDADLIALKPSNMSMAEAAALPLIFITAWEGLVDRARVSAGQQVLIQGGAGGVGHIAVQIAKAMGAEVFATASAANRHVIEGLGAVAIDYRAHSAGGGPIS
jgi:NADPH:quinone reductase-like Zn-dependent oxidoreductase